MTNKTTEYDGKASTPAPASAPLAFPKFTLPKYPSVWAAGFIIALIFIISAVRGTLGDIGPDSDDAMRLVQIRDYLNGQSWFDTDQYRLGLAGGTDMHWSRLVDVPIIMLTHIFDLVLPRDTALQIAYSVWPPFSALLLIFAMVKGARYWDAHRSLDSAQRDAVTSGPQLTWAFTLILLAFFCFGFYRFQPGAIDHHNVQMGLVALGVAFALDPKSRFKTGLLSGLFTALSVAVGVEVYVFIAVICGYVAVNWLIKGRAVRASTQGFGLGLTLGLGAAFFGTLPASDYGRVLCDSLSLITVSAGGVGGLGLTAIATWVPGESFKSRILATVGLGAVCLAVLSQQAPQCLANPLSAIPEEVDRLWLSNIGEARSMPIKGWDALASIPMLLFPPLIALCLIARNLWSARSQARPLWSGQMLIGALLIVSIALMIYQLRFFPFAYVFAILPLAAWVGDYYRKGRARVAAFKDAAAVSANDDDPRPSEPINVAYIFALAASIPIVWMVPSLLFTNPDMANTTDNEAPRGDTVCYSDDVLAALGALPKGLVSATSNGGAPILMDTHHRALSGNYHRNIAGISQQIKISISDPSVSKALLREAGVDYLHFCRVTKEADILVEENEDGLFSALMNDSVPDYLVPATDALEDGAVSIYRVVLDTP